MKQHLMNKKRFRAFAGPAIAATFALGLVACTDGAPTKEIAAIEAVASDKAAVATVQTVYSGFAAGDMGMVTSVMSPDIVWNEAEGNPYADKNPYIGPDAILSGLFARLGGEWIGFTATPNEYVIEGNRVIVFGRYTANYRATGQALDAPFVHSWTLQDSKVVGFQQYTDTAEHAAIMAK